MKKAVLVCVVLFIITSCDFIPTGTSGPLSGPTDTLDIHTGTDGLEIEFLDNSPPDELFEYVPTVVSFSAHNTGATNIDEGYFSIAIDPGTHLLHDIFDNSAGELNLRGKSSLDTVGEKRVFTTSVSARELPVSIESLEERVTVHVCYKYNTIANTNVCVDTDIGGLRVEEKLCDEGTSTVSGGQGGPITLTSVKVQSIPIRGEDRILPIITFTLENEGGGDVMLASETSQLCRGVFPSSIDKARMQAFISKKRLTCNKEEVSFKEGSTTVICRLEEGLEKILGNFYASFRVEVDYGYHQSIKKTVAITSTATIG